MSTKKIHQENYLYFLNESEDLLRTIETELLHLREQRTQSKVYGLMRATHTLKGAAAIVGQKTIQDLSHYLENVFQALLDPTVGIDGELETLLFQGYECLRLALAAEIRGDAHSLDNIKNQGADLFSKIQQKLGDALARENAIPSSAELGFDIVQSVFEVGVKEKLTTMMKVWETGNLQKIVDIFVPTTEIFIGLGESLKLPGFRAIANATIQALHTHPQDAATIGQLALEDLQAGYDLVMGGDRAQGGTPSPQLLEFTSATIAKAIATKLDIPEEAPTPKPANNNSPPNTSQVSPLPYRDRRLIPPQGDPVPNLYSLNLETKIEPSPKTKIEIQPEDAALAELFGNVEIPETMLSDYVSSEAEMPAGMLSEYAPLGSEDLIYVEPEELITSESDPTAPLGNYSPEFPKPPRNTTTLRVELEQLEHQNYLAGELLINQNQVSLQEERRYETLQKLSGWLSQHRKTIDELKKHLTRGQLQGETPDVLDTVLEETVQLEQATADLTLYSQNAQQLIDREQRLLKQVRESMQQTRMMPIGNVLNRLGLITQQLTSVYKKPVEIQLQGLEVLIDKAIAESLYEALLHLIRNAFAHGIEPPEVRRQYQKPEVGTIRVSAYNQGNRTVIEVRDDGAGLNLEQIFTSALSHNLLTSVQVEQIKQLPQPESKILDLLCSPGLSTREDVDDLAGRGIGLNVVRSQLQSIRGNLTLQSQPHRGTTFFLQIKGALMSARLLSCRAGGRVYTFVANEIIQTLMPFVEQIKTIGNQRSLNWHDGSKEVSVPLYRLTTLLNEGDRYIPEVDGEGLELIPLLTPRQGRTPVLLLPKAGGFIGLEVDQVIEEQELVIKPIPEAIPSPDYIYGCTVLADGNMTLVIDGVALVNYQDQGISWTEDTLGIFAGEAELSPTERGSATQVLTQTTILIVDDSITERQKLSLVLQKSGYHVQQAKDGVDALEQLQKNPSIPLVICDLEMPRMTGFEFLSVTRQQPDLAKIPVVMLTSRGSNQYRQIASSLGAIAYFTKPYLDYQLISKVKEVLDSGQ